MFLRRRQAHTRRSALSQFLKDGGRDPHLAANSGRDSQETNLVKVLKRWRVGDEFRQGASPKASRVSSGMRP
ncbi:MAG: hypothetical protein BRD42_07500 [Bacteroidetes bacterium QS_3_64_15]|nr:MAG: hypothetical protein BRD42_07500 [Bacteroidetes bacterium QS_3_64_15]